jgi:hypothetical protein
MFSPDGRQVATSSKSEVIAGSRTTTTRVFETVSGNEVLRMILGRQNLGAPVLYEPDLASRFVQQWRYLMTASLLGSDSLQEVILTRHLLRPQDLVDDACMRLTRNLTQEEWKQYVGTEVPYHRTCPNLP